ncbi:ParB/RepB/Spo0J family partition protein [uncultured Desulfosarcina sp.]|uniref:ParB/RepB/Spo0J family partition protein n=1 Tax=uncultured Desulfosarcina sp. TaxID=218289 RepID=UPI0029C603E0|nr:ParB/RepB/Spo0J family partition protein [uncultured Desulfosarcina sp.]
MAIVSIKNIICDPQVMPREKIDENHVNELVEDLNSGAVFPPVDLFHDGKHYYAADGYHRIEAFKKVGRDEIDAIVHDGDKRDALVFASGANACHGKRRTNEDKRKAVTNLLMDPEWRQESDVTIAEHCKVSQPFVLKVRRWLESTYNGYKSPSRRKTKTGGTMETKNIGKGESNSTEQKKTVSIKIIPTKEDLPPKPFAKKTSVDNDDDNGSDDTEIPSPLKDFAKAHAEICKMIKDLETALHDLKKAMPSKENSNLLSEIDISNHWNRFSHLHISMAACLAKYFDLG